jgi:MSHA biogenesis protein MshI
LSLISNSASRALRWPWQRKAGSQHLVLSWCEGTLAFMRLERDAAGANFLLDCGVEHKGLDSSLDFVQRLRGLNLKGLTAQIMLRPGQYQMLEIDRPAVAASELRQAVRYQLQGMLEPLAPGMSQDANPQDITLDVIPVGLLEPVGANADGPESDQARIFVVAASTPLLRELLVLADAMQWAVSVIDIQETAQRNLQLALAKKSQSTDISEQAQASLLLIAGQAAVLTISAGQALLYSRRLELPKGFLAEQWHVDGQSKASFIEPQGASTAESAGAQDYRGQQHALAQLSAGLFNPQAPDGRELVLQLQRSLDLWERSRTGRRLTSLQVFAGSYSQSCASWLTGRLGRSVQPLNAAGLLSGFEPDVGPQANQLALCLPLLGASLRQSSPLV